MDPPVKAGPLLLQQPPGLLLGGKRWKKSWFVLYPASTHGVARLEFFDCKEGAAAGADRAGTKRLDKKIVRLADCVSVAPAPDCGPREGLVTFRLETSQRTFLFAAEPQEAADWVDRLCETAFPQQQQSPGQVAQPAADRAREQPWEMATNSIYFSQEEVSEFWVTAQKTEAAERCGLQGRYLLKASREGLLLADSRSGRPLYSWPYRLLRRYGRDKVMFSFEAGRRCESGPGNFTFETTQGNEIFRLVEAAIQSQKAEVEENRRSGASVDAAADGASVVGQLHAAVAASLSLEGDRPGPERRQRWEGVPRNTLAATLSSGAVEGEGKERPGPALKGQAAPRDSPAPRPSPPPLPLEEEAAAAATSVYSEPLDAVGRGSLPRPDPVYADPVDSKGGKESGRPRSPEWLLYEQVGPGAGGKGHIYDEPEGRAPQPTPTPTPTVAIYDEARLPSEAWRTQGVESPSGYELPYLPSAGDYAVPAFPPKAGLPRGPKPCPTRKPPRGQKSTPQQGSTGKPRTAPRRDELRNGSGGGGSNQNNSNNTAAGTGEPVYSRVRKPPRGCWRPGEEQSVDSSRPASAVYEDLGEI